ncbi:MAG: DsbC family protein, partial [Rubrivivax sp.]
MTFFKHLLIAALAALSLSALAQEAAIRKTLAERLPNL